MLVERSEVSDLQRVGSIETAYSWVVVAASLAISSLSFGAVTSIPILMKPMVSDLGWTRSTISMAHALAMVAAGFSGVLFGRMADRRSFLQLSLAAGAAIGAGLWLSSVAHSPWLLYLPYAILVGGIGQGIFFGPITATVSHWFDRNRSLAMAIVMCGQSVGGLTIPVVLRIAAEEWGWRNTMMAYGLFCTPVIGLLCLVFVRQPSTKLDRAKSPEDLDLPSSREQLVSFFNIVLALIFCNSGSFIVIAHLVALAEEQGLTPLFASVLLAVTLGITLLSRLTAGVLLDRNFPEAVLYVSSLLVPAGVLMLCFGHGLFVVMMLGGVLFGLGFGGVFPVYVSLVRSIFPAAVAGAWISTMFLFAFLAAAAGSWLGGVFHDVTGDYIVALYTAVSSTSLSLVIALIVLRKPLKAFRESRTIMARFCA